MKKKLLILTIFLALITVVTGCTSKKTNNENKKEEIIIKDEKTGYTVKFEFDKTEDFKISKTDNSGKFIDVTVTSEKENIEMEFYYFEMTNTSYNISYNSRKEQEGFKEYTFGKYKGYIYGVDDNSFDLNILLFDGGETAMSIGLFGDISKLDYKGTKTMVEIFESETVQNFFKSIQFTK